MASGGVLGVRSIFRPNLFKGKVAIVTGGATGIGKAVAEELLYLGCSVTIASRNEDNLKNAVKDFQKRLLPEKEKKNRATFVPCNVRKEDQVKMLIKQTLDKHGRLDFLVNNGGDQFMSSAESISLNGWNAVVETNLTGTFILCREAYEQWMEHHGGAIVNMAMDNSRGLPMFSHSGAARAGVENLTRSLIERAASGVRVNTIKPGMIFSETAAKNYEGDLFALVRPRLPAKRPGTTQEVSSAVCFLLSPGASYVSGATLTVDAAGALYPALAFEIPEHDQWPKHDSCSEDDKEVPSKL